MAPSLQHIAIIMDGNGRWAKKRLLPRTVGHVKGAANVRHMVKACAQAGVSYLTLFAFSSENWRRPPEEISALMGLFLQYLENEAAEIMKSFYPLADNEKFVLEEGGSIRNSLYSGDIEHLSTILLSKEETTLDDVREVGTVYARGDKYYAIKLKTMPNEVEEYIAGKNVQIFEADGTSLVFVNKIDGKIITIELPLEQTSADSVSTQGTEQITFDQVA